ncbi:MAG TPA: cytochrome c3 family protein [Gemmataceae bacterium]|nr:cytochrome c3 family protein [Gemmataceae bacterium]
MPQVFHRSFNTISRVTIFGAVFILAFLGWCMAVVARSSYVTNVGITREQPVQFSHEHHVTGLGIDCRYCHGTVETAAYPGMPPTKTCMNCHQQIWVGSQELAPIRESYRTGKPIEWSRVHRLGEFVYFDHSVHVNKGFGCESCHGPVNNMPLMWQHGTLLMEWCLDCHRAPEQYLRPKDAVFEMNWTPAKLGTTQDELGPRLALEYHVGKLIHCSTCHR